MSISVAQVSHTLTTPRRRSGLNGLCLGEKRRVALTREGLQEHRLAILTDLDVVIDASVFKSTVGTLVALY